MPTGIPIYISRGASRNSICSITRIFPDSKMIMDVFNGPSSKVHFCCCYFMTYHKGGNRRALHKVPGGDPLTLVSITV